MTQAEIDAFLAVYRQHSISLAAQEMYLSQPALSALLGKLEKEIGTRLFCRGRGTRTVQATSAGEQFFPLAISYRELMEKMHAVGNPNGGHLRVSAVSSIGNFLFPPVFRRFAEKYPNVTLQTQELDTMEAYQSIEQGQTDIAFTPGLHTNRTVFSFPAFSEQMFLLGRKSAVQDGITAAEIKTENEIYLDWSREFCKWHQDTFAKRKPPRICLGPTDQVSLFLRREDTWVIAPAATANGICGKEGIEKVTPAFSLPSRVTYCLCHREPEPLAQAFLDCLREELQSRSCEGITLLMEKSAP